MIYYWKIWINLFFQLKKLINKIEKIDGYFNNSYIK